MPVDARAVIRDLLATQLVDEAIRHLWKPYEWGGNGPDTFDCSGYILYLLRKVGLWGDNDAIAQDIFLRFRPYKVTKPYKGCLVFYGDKETDIAHVVLALNERFIIGANGHDIKRVSIEPIDYRTKRYNYTDYLCQVDPTFSQKTLA